MLIGQIITIPLAYFCQFKAAYFFTYVAGLFYGTQLKTITFNRKSVDYIIYGLAITGVFVRIYLDIHPVYPKAVSSLFVQWLKLFQGAGVFIFLFNNVPKKLLEGKEKILEYLSGMTYEVYLVHEFYTCDIFTNLLPFSSMFVELFVVWICVIVTAFFLKKVTRGLNKCLS